MRTAVLYYLVPTADADRPAPRDAPAPAPAPTSAPDAGIWHATRSAATYVFAAMRALIPQGLGQLARRRAAVQPSCARQHIIHRHGTATCRRPT